MLKNPLISFIVTSYNYARYIEKTLDSIKDQSYQHFEIIVVDDASSDDSVNIIENYIQNNQQLRITLLTHQKTCGQFASMLDGLKVAEGVFVCFIDSDDVLLKDYAKVHVGIHMSSNVAFTSAAMIEIDEKNQVHSLSSIASPYNNYIHEPCLLEDFLAKDVTKDVKYYLVKKKHFGAWYWSPNSSAMYRKSALNLILLYHHPEIWKICPDKFLYNIMHLVGGSINIETPLIAYRRHENNAGGDGYICGNTRYHTNKTTYNNIKNNIKIRPEALKFFIYARKEIVKSYGTRGFIRMFLRIFI